MHIKQKVSSLLFKIARSPVAGLFIGFTFAYLSKLMPVKRLAESANSIAFYHPVPSYDFHGLVVPKMIKPAFLAFDFKDEVDRSAIIDIVQQCQFVAQTYELKRYSIIVNGGSYQDVPQVHFHIAFNNAVEEDGSTADLVELSSADEAVTCFRPVNSHWAYHRVLRHHQIKSNFSETIFDDSTVQTAVIDLLEVAQQTINSEQMAAFSVIIEEDLLEPSPFSIEIVSNHLVSN